MNIIKMIGLCSLIVFSFFYTDKVIEVIREEDVIMVELDSVKDIYRVDAIDAVLIGNTIVPGLNGRDINRIDSYKKMKASGSFNKNLFVYDDILPNVSVHNNKDKFIVSGNNNKQMVSLLFIINNDKYLDKIDGILKAKEVYGNYFVSYSYLINNSTKVKQVDNGEVYSYGDNGKYMPDNLLFSNNLISRIKDNEAIFCLASNMEEEILNLCSSNNLYTIVPTMVLSDNPYNAIKNNLSSGSIILVELNSETMSEIATIIDYIKGKGLKVGRLSELLSEEL